MRHDLILQTFGRLKVVKFNGSRKVGNKTKAFWDCICICGKSNIVEASNLKSGHTKSCGCLAIEMCGEKTFKHGLTNTTEFHSWSHAKGRCYNIRNYKYKNYGGRGIKMCDKWKNNFMEFYKDMGKKPEGKTLERINVNGDYEPSNCKWATHIEQGNNKVFNRIVVLNGVKMTLANCARLHGKKYRALHFYYHSKGYEINKAISLTPNI